MPAAKPGNRTAGEGPGRTARMHVPEESDSGDLFATSTNHFKIYGDVCLITDGSMTGHDDSLVVRTGKITS